MKEGIRQTELAKVHDAFAEDNPEWAAMALRTINLWGEQRVTLLVAIGEALKTAHSMGRLGEFPQAPQKDEPEPPPARVVRTRTRSAQPEPEPIANETRRVIRRSR